MFSYFWIDLGAGADQSNLHFLMKFHSLEQGLHFKNPKFASYVVEREWYNYDHPLWFSSPLLFWSVWLPRKFNFLIVFQTVFHGFSWEKNGLIPHSFISQFLIYLDLSKNSISSCVDSRIGQDRACVASKCVLKEKSEKLKMESTNQVVREW